jgi:hypothetical protein
MTGWLWCSDPNRVDILWCPTNQHLSATTLNELATESGQEIDYQHASFGKLYKMGFLRIYELKGVLHCEGYRDFLFKAESLINDFVIQEKLVDYKLEPQDKKDV